MWKKILAISLVLVMVLSFSACAEELLSAQEISSGVIESLDDIRTYQFDIDMTMDMAGEVEGEAIEGTMTMDGSGTLDLENSKMRTDMAMNIVMAEQLQMEMGMEMYLIGDMMYMLTDIPGMGPMWTKMEMPAGYWEKANQIESQTILLETAQVEVIGSEKVGGVDCYVLQLTPDMEQLWQTIMQQVEVTGEVPGVTEELLQEMFQSFSVKQWVDKDTYFLTKADVDMTIELTSEAMGLLEEEGIITMDITMKLLAHNYNEPVSIELPPEAEEAIEIPFGGY